ncbi:APC family permease [Arenibacter echinorum]|uniref:Amino acid transporter n=1 Tax=Arenibacter echinorum TaxID=440515 RepID=A0A327R5E5_9FLAO|nr:APC family permease [Arenibacter echinorum]RAJ09157.1 amino acid transporter [Arenibacter echinorum]
MKETNEHLKREVGVMGLSANLVNIMIGAGIFALPAIVAAGLGSSSIFAYLFCGLLIALVMLCFAEVGSKVTTSGGAYTYIETSFGPYFGFLTVILFVLSATSADAAVSNALVDIIGTMFPVFKSNTLRILIFFILFGTLGYVNVRGIKEGMSVVKTITIIKLIPLLLLVIFSWGEVSLDHLAINSVASIEDIGKISLILFFAFQGAESGLSISGEVKDPNKNIPKAIFISVVGVLILYILIQTVSLGVLGASLATFKENPLSYVADQVFGPIGFTIITVGAAVSMLGNLSSEILSIPRVLFRASKDKVLPLSTLSKVHDRFSTPYIAIIGYASSGFLLATFGGFQQMAIISSASILLVYLGVTLAVIKQRRKKLIRTKNEFRIPGGYLVPMLSVIIIVWLLSNMERQEFIGFGISLTILTFIYFLKGIFWKKK